MAKRGRRPGQRTTGSLAWKISRLEPGHAFWIETDKPHITQRHVQVELSRNELLPRVVCRSYRAVPYRGEPFEVRLLVQVRRPKE